MGGASINEPTWVRDDVVIAIHKRQIAEHGGSSGVRDSGLLSSALARPRNLLAYEEGGTGEVSIAQLAAAYLIGIVKNHPFVDGNKRVGWAVAWTFVRLNECDIAATREEKYDFVFGVAAGTIGEQACDDWMAEHVIRE